MSGVQQPISFPCRACVTLIQRTGRKTGLKRDLLSLVLTKRIAASGNEMVQQPEKSRNTVKEEQQPRAYRNNRQQVVTHSAKQQQPGT